MKEYPAPHGTTGQIAIFMNAAVTEYDGTLLQKAIANAHTTYSRAG